MPSMSKGIVKAPSTFFSEPGGFKNPHTSDHPPGTAPGLHNGGGPGGTGKSVLANTSSMMLVGRGSLPDWRRQAAPLKSPATMSTCSCNITARTASSNFFPIPRFLAKWLLMCSDFMVKKKIYRCAVVFGMKRGRRRPVRPIPDCPS